MLIPLSGGVSCEVAIVREADGREIVVKQALPKLKVKADWRADPARASTEVAAINVIRELLGPAAAPEVLWEDPTHHRFAMARIDPRLANWRDELNARRIDLSTAERVGEMLGQLHLRAATRTDIAARFANRTYFEQLRIEPFFHRIAQRNPSLASYVNQAIELLRAPGQTLVHGDFSPKNLLTAGREVVILDCEVAHWGEPRFDLGYCLMHLILDGAHRPPARDYLRAALAFLDGYARACDAQRFDVELVRITGCLLLARLEGDSPIDFLDEIDAAAVKRIALEMIVRPDADVRAAVRKAMS